MIATNSGKSLFIAYNVDAILDGINDFIKGVEWLRTCNPEKLNQERILQNIKTKGLESLNVDFDYGWYRVCCNIKDCDLIHKIVRIVTLNGLLMKSNRVVILPYYANQPVQAYRASQILYYDELTNHGHICQKSWTQILKKYCRFLKITWKIRFNYKHVSKDYASAFNYLSSREFWDNYLE
ncbi:hypothetical protein LJC58_10160 [Lachnospiraceae bacterium OttesenSCG-928-D06]|nr:hypothetical protein [Lachnospiraceae bacterium OttesenSCG-928-D06]